MPNLLRSSLVALSVLSVGACAFVPRNVEISAVEGRIVYPRETFSAVHHVAFGPFEDRRPSQTRLGVGRNKFMMVTTSIGIEGDLRALLQRVVRQNFAASGIGEGRSPITVKGTVFEATTDAVGPDHVYVQVTVSLTILDSTSNVPILHRILAGRTVTPVTQISNMAWEDAFVGALNQISGEVQQIAAVTASAIRSAAQVAPQPVPPSAGLSGTFTGEIAGIQGSKPFTMRVTFTLVQTDDHVAGTWNTTGGTSGTMTARVVERRLVDFRARQINPCHGEFQGAAVIEAGGVQLRGTYVGSGCELTVNASFVVNRQ